VSVANLYRPICSMGQPGCGIDWSCNPFEPLSYFAQKQAALQCTMHFGCAALDLRRFEGSTLAGSTAERRNSRTDGQKRARGNSGCVKQPLLRNESCYVA
jgi:hypothetical protein